MLDVNEAHDTYVMPCYAVLVVEDMTASTCWYANVLGFEIVEGVMGPDHRPLLSHLRWARYADLVLVPNLAPAPSPQGKGVGVSLHFTVTGCTVDDFARGVKDRGAEVVSGPVTQPWNARELTVRDPDGYRLTFTKPMGERFGISCAGQILRNG